MEAQIAWVGNSHKVFSGVNIEKILGPIVLSSFLAISIPSAVAAPASGSGDGAASQTNSADTPPSKPDPKASANCTQASSDVVKCLGLGLAVGGFFFTEPDITTTTIDAGTRNVRVTEEHQREASVWFETHATIFPLGEWLGQTGLIGGISVGPFAAIQLGGTAGTFSSFAAGGMIYFPTKMNGDSDSLISGLGLGIGYGWTQVHSLGDGVKEDQPLPANLTTVPTKQTDIGGLVVMLSTTIALGN